MTGPSDQEQLFLELINEARLDPMRNASRYLTSYSPLQSSDPNIQAALNFFKVSGSDLLTAYQALTPVAPVAWNDSLAVAAEKHTQQMIGADEQSHQVAGELGLGDRIRAEGYNFLRAGENVYAFSENIMYGHAGFMVDWGNGPGGMQSPAGHRINIMSANFSEVGIDVTAENNAATQVGPMLVTQDFGDRGLTFVTGVAYSDTDKNQFYSLGEGRGDLRVQWGTSSTMTAVSGGYSLGITSGLKTITLSGGGLTSAATVKTTIGDDNIKLDVVDGNTLLTSTSVEVSGPISVIRGLGTIGLTLTAGAGSQRLVGTIGNDTLAGGEGDDQFSGGAGADAIDGGAGRDVAIYDQGYAQYTVRATGDGRITVTGSESGTDTLSSIEVFRFADGDKYWNAAQGKLTSSTNSAPVAAPTQTVTTAQGTEKQITVSATDADGDPLTFTAGVAAHGTVTGGSGGIFTYKPQAGFFGSDSFMATINDGNGGTTTQTVNINIQAASASNSAPVADKILRISGYEDSVRQSKIVATDADGDPLSFTVGIQPSNGTIVMGRDGLYTYTPRKDYVGADSFSVIISDGRGGSTTQAVELWIYDVNDAPVVANTQSTWTKPGESKQITVSAVDPDKDAMTYAAGRPGNGTVTGDRTSGVFNYTPNAGFTGKDTFTVTVSDGKGGTSVQTITIDVTATAPNYAPTVTVSQAVSTNEDTAKQVTVAATDNNNDPLTYTAGAAGHGTVTGGTGGVFTYTPTANYNGSDSFVVTVSDGKGGTATQTVNVSVAAVNDAPKVNASQDVTTNKGTSKAINVAATDADGDSLIYTAGAAAHGTITGGANGAFTYTPTAGYTGTDKFIVAVNDGKGGSSAQTINVTVTGSNQPAPSTTQSYRTFLADGFSGEINGGGTVYGTNGFQKIVLADRPGAITFDGSFNKGGDVLRIAGNASSFEANVDGGSVVLIEGDRSYTIPYGSVGTKLVFDDGVRTLAVVGGAVKIGNQTIDDMRSILVAPTDNSSVPNGADASAFGRSFLIENGQIAIGGQHQVFGTSTGKEIVSYLGGDLFLDGSFNKGGDTLILPDPLSSYKAYMSGMSLVLISAKGDIFIPVGDKAMTLNFGGQELALRFDGSDIKVGTIAITAETEGSAIQLGGSGGGTGGGALTELDGVGNPTSDTGFVTLDAGTGAKTYDEGNGATHVLITDFGSDDVIVLTDVNEIKDYNFSTGTGANKTDLIINHTASGGVASIIILDDVLTSTKVFDYASALASVGHEFITLG